MDHLTSKQIIELSKCFKFISIKDIMELSSVSESTAKQLYRDIKQHYQLKTRPVMWHYTDYLNIPITKMVENGQL